MFLSNDSHYLYCYPVKQKICFCIGITFNRVAGESEEQWDLFTDPASLERERKIQSAVLDIEILP